jgi:tRNA-binding EMAP/Myf-like protein
MKPAPVKPDVTFDDLRKLDIRVGTIESVDDVEGSKKLVKLIVNFGDHTRTIQYPGSIHNTNGSRLNTLIPMQYVMQL